MDRSCPDDSKIWMTHVEMSHGIGSNIFDPFYESEYKITQNFNPKCCQMHWPCPDDSIKILHLKLESLMVLEIIYSILLMRVGIEWQL